MSHSVLGLAFSSWRSVWLRGAMVSSDGRQSLGRSYLSPSEHRDWLFGLQPMDISCDSNQWRISSGSCTLCGKMPPAKQAMLVVLKLKLGLLSIHCVFSRPSQALG